MKKLLAIFLIIGAIFCLFTSSVLAAPYKVEFGDEVYHWDGWGGVGTDDNNDVIGTPNLKNDITGHHNNYAEITKLGYLEKVHFVYEKNSTTLHAGSLFIDIGADSTWDYVLQPALRTLNTTNTIYHLTNGLDLNSPDYIKSDYFYNSGYRENHPVAIDSSKLDVSEIGTFKLTDFKKRNANNGHVIFERFSIDLEGLDFIIGFGPTCANDVIYETVNNPVPIPTSILLFGSGLIGLAGIKRRRR